MHYEEQPRMKLPTPEDRALQETYYTETAVDYDIMHNAETGEHALALEYVVSICNQYNLRSIIDVGCGTGVAVRNFNRKGLLAKGIEAIQALIDIGIKAHGLKPDQIEIGVAEKLPYSSGSVDAICEFAVLHHVKDARPAVNEMLRVAKHAVFLSDENRFGRGSLAWRLTKLLWWKLGVFPLGFWLMTKGKGYNYTKGDGVSYSYSVFDSHTQLAAWADAVFYIPLKQARGQSWAHPLLTASHVLACAIRHPEATAK